MVRLAEATASRELLFRELVAVLQQESQAKKIIIAEPGDDDKKLRPFITHGYTLAESSEVVGKFEEATQKKGEKIFSKNRNLAVFPLKTVNAKPAFLIEHQDHLAARMLTDVCLPYAHRAQSFEKSIRAARELEFRRLCEVAAAHGEGGLWWPLQVVVVVLLAGAYAAAVVRRRAGLRDRARGGWRRPGDLLLAVPPVVVVLYAASDSTWYTASSSTGIYEVVRFGLPGDIIVPGDYDGDG